MSCVYSSGRSRGLFAEVEKLQDLISELSQGEVVGGGQGTVVNRQKPYRITMNIFWRSTTVPSVSKHDTEREAHVVHPLPVQREWLDGSSVRQRTERLIAQKHGGIIDLKQPQFHLVRNAPVETATGCKSEIRRAGSERIREITRTQALLRGDVKTRVGASGQKVHEWLKATRVTNREGGSAMK